MSFSLTNVSVCKMKLGIKEVVCVGEILKYDNCYKTFSFMDYFNGQ